MDQEIPRPNEGDQAAFNARTTELQGDLDAEIARGHREGWARTLFLLALVIVLWVLTFRAPFGAWIFAGLALGWCAWTGFALWPRRCAVCGTRTMLSLPLPTYMRPRWWDVRPPRRSQLVPACAEHVGVVMIQRALGMEAAEKFERWRHELP